MPFDPPLDFGVDLVSVRDRVAAMGYFLAVTDLQNAAVGIDSGLTRPPQAFVSIASETASPNRIMGSNNKAQRVRVKLSILFAENAGRAAGDETDIIEKVRRAIIRQCMNWTPEGAISSLEYDRYLTRAIIDGTIWGEVLFDTSYRLDG